MGQPIDTQEFWDDRLVNAGQELHRAVYDTDVSEWDKIQESHRTVLRQVVRDGYSVLDAGCGYGALLEIMPDVDFSYVGLDLSRSLLKKAVERYPGNTFVQGDLRRLPFGDRQFRVAVCRSMEGVVRQELGEAVWDEMEAELLRVAQKVILLNYTLPDTYCSLESRKNPEETTLNYVEHEHGRLAFRLGLGGVCEIYDIFVDRDYRRQGIGTKLHQAVFARGFNTVYEFSKFNNTAIILLQKKLGFHHASLPGFYGGTSAVIAYRNSKTVGVTQHV